MDLLVLAFELAFGGSLAVAAGLLLATYVAFARMNKDLRRARMFIMSDRVRRFLGAFTFGFVAIAAASILSVAGVPDAGVVFTVVLFLFLGAIVYGSLELFLIVRPRRSRLPVRGKPSSRVPRLSGPQNPSPDEAAEGDADAAR